MSRPIVFLDLYCGAGGYSTGFAEAMHDLGLPYYDVAVNHWERAIETMQTNHPDVIAMQVDISAVNLCDIDVDVIDLLHASPSCTHHSRAKGGKPRDNQLRSQPNEIWKFVDNKHVRRITIENVPEFTKWGPLTTDGKPIKRKEGECFRAWLQQFTARGYTYEYRILNCSDYGDATSRKRFFLQAVKHGCGKIRWPEPTHAENPQPDLFGRTLKPYYLHWFNADPFASVVVLVVGDYKASFKEIDRKFKLRPNLPKADRVPFSDGLAEVLEKNPPKGDLEHCGRTVQSDGLDVFVWFPVFPTPGTLAHELMHAKDDILNSAGVTDTNGETDAYLLGAMYEHFFSMLEKDKAQEKRK